MVDPRALVDFPGLLACKGVRGDLRAVWEAWWRPEAEERVLRIDLYTDGAAELSAGWPRQVVSSGWALVLVGDTDASLRAGRLALLGVAFGPVVLQPGHLEYIGATRHSAPVAELCGIWAALALCARLPEVGRLGAALWTDSLYAMQVVGCQARAVANWELVAQLRGAWLRVRPVLRMGHVRAHRGQPANELADVLAEWGRRGRSSGFVARLGRQLLPEAPAVAQVPALSLESLLFWSDVIDAEDPMGGEAVASEGAAFDLRLATANVLTLHPQEDSLLQASLRRRDLAQQFHEDGLMVIGIQEARGRQAGSRQTEHYMMISSQAAEGGYGGCELWLHRRLGVRADSVFALVSQPRRLAVRFDTTLGCLVVVVLHGLDQAAGAEAVEQWWLDTGVLLRQLAASAAARGGAFCLCADANARLGSVCSSAVGEAEADQECFAGQFLHEILLEHQLCAPATFLGGGPTWFAHAGAGHRIDFVAVPRRWLPAAVSARVLPRAVLALNGAVDHAVAVVDIRLGTPSAEQRRPSGAQPRAWYRRDALKLVEVRQAIERVWLQVPELPVQWSAGRMASAVAKASRLTLACLCPRQAPAPRRDWLSAAAWQHVLAHRGARRCFFQAVEWRTAWRRRFLFGLWRFAVGGQAGDVAVLTTLSRQGREFDVALARADRLLRELSRAARRAATSDFRAWVAQQAERAAAAAARGQFAPVWRLVRQVAGRRRQTRGPRPLPVLRLASGEIVGSAEARAELWRDKFRAEFGGNTELVDLAAIESVAGRVRAPLPPEYRASEAEWFAWLSDALACAVSGKAVGPDQVPSEFLQAAGPSMLAALARVAVASTRDGLPTAWRGGTMVPVPRKASVPFSFDNARGVLLADHAAKVVGRVLRNQVSDAFARLVHGWQLGAVAHGGTEYPSHAVRLFLQLGVLAKRPTAVIFADLRAAFYRAWPELALGPLLLDSERVELFRRAGVSAEVADGLQQLIAQEDTDLKAQGVDRLWRHLLADWHTGNFFSVADDAFVVRTLAGVRPGDPVADLVFALVFFTLQRAVAERLEALELVPLLPLTPGVLFVGAHPQVEQVPLRLPTYMDDFVVPLSVDCPVELLRVTAVVAAELRQAAATFGMELNFAENKTEVVMHLVGPRLGEAKQLLVAREVSSSLPPQAWVPHLPVGGGAALRVVPAYRHLGIMANSARTNGAEVASRAAGASAAAAAMMRPIFRQTRLPQQIRRMLAKACVDTRALYGAGTWDVLTRGQRAKLDAVLARPLRGIVGARFVPGEPPPSSSSARRRLGEATVEGKIAVARLRYAPRAVAYGPPYLIALLQGPAGLRWRRELQADLFAMWRLLHTKLAELPDPLLDPHAWQMWWQRWPGQWLAMVSRFETLAAEDPRRFAQLRASALGVPWQPEDLDSDGEYVCFRCPEAPTFRTAASLKLHVLHKHAERCVARHYVIGTVCPVCKVDFRQRLRVLTHLTRGAVHCRQVVAAGTLPRFEPEAVAAADEADRLHRRAARAAGRHEMAGPPARLAT